MKRSDLTCAKWARRSVFFALAVLAFSGCSPSIQVEDKPTVAVSGEQKTFALKEITPQQAMDFLSELGLGMASISPDSNGVIVVGSAADLYRAGVVLDLVDTSEAYLIETLAPVSDARAVPTNGEITAALGNVVVGTFASPPQAGERGRAIIDIHGESVVAVIPARIQRELLAFVEFGAEGLRRARGEPEAAKTAETAVCEEAKTPPPVAEVNEPVEVISATVLPGVSSVVNPREEPAAAAPSETAGPSATTPVEVSPTGGGATAELASESVDERQETVGRIVPSSPLKKSLRRAFCCGQ